MMAHEPTEITITGPGKKAAAEVLREAMLRLGASPPSEDTDVWLWDGRHYRIVVSETTI